jgi:uncharacterized membrane protein YkoI
MLRYVTAGLVALPLVTGAAKALPPEVSTYIGTDATSIAKALQGMGFEVRSIGLDESGYEAEIVDVDAIYDITIDATDGLVTNVELDTDVDGDA